MNNPSPNTKIVIQSYEAYANAMRLLTDEEQKQVSFLGFMYPLKETEKLHNQALILTNSDQIEALESLVTSLPNLTFNIGALTEMSSDLINMIMLYSTQISQQIKYNIYQIFVLFILILIIIMRYYQQFALLLNINS